jgi:hypothetical protein
MTQMYIQPQVSKICMTEKFASPMLYLVKRIVLVDSNTTGLAKQPLTESTIKTSIKS